jgi:hypothetical protein
MGGQEGTAGLVLRVVISERGKIQGKGEGD